jgi:mannosyltransferase OCH1-like enzyme
MPDLFRQWGDQLQAMHPDWGYRLWTDGDFGWLDNQDLYDAAPDLVVDHKVGQLRSNLARYEILREHGGVWLDADVQPLRPLDGVWGPDVFAGWERQDEFIGTSVLGGVAGHPFWQACIDALRLPQYLTPPEDIRMVTHLAPQYGVHVYPERTFYPYRTHDIGSPQTDFGDSFVAHHWNHLRTVRGKPL